MVLQVQRQVVARRGTMQDYRHPNIDAVRCVLPKRAEPETQTHSPEMELIRDIQPHLSLCSVTYVIVT